MTITDVRVTLARDNEERVLAYCSVTFDNDFVVRDLKVVLGNQGIFVAVPCRKLPSRCPHCDRKNPLSAHYCNECGSKLENQASRDPTKLHADIAHPINNQFRQLLQTKVLEAYAAKKQRVALLMTE